MENKLAVTAPQRVPLWVKLAFTAFVAVLVPYYWREYGPTNFLYYCDVALFLALLATWTEKPIFASMAAVGITIPQILWQIDFLAQWIELPLTGMTDYMFDPGISLFARGLSFFHFWLPLMLLYFVWRLGYDRRAFAAWTILAWVLMLICFFVLPPAGAELDFPNQPHNVNYVYGMDDAQPQSWMPAWAWLSLLIVGLPTIIFLPTHLALKSVSRFAVGADREKGTKRFQRSRTFVIGRGDQPMCHAQRDLHSHVSRTA